MGCYELDAVILGQCARLDGSRLALDIIKHNQKLAPVIRSENFIGECNPPVSEHYLPNRLENLSPTQSRTFDQILKGKSISAIAEEEGVSRSAIYSRIRGSHGRGGMIRKNLWAFIWWSFMANEDEL